MSLTIDLPPDLESRLRAEAAKRGVPLPELALLALEQLVAPPEEPGEATAGESVLRIIEEIHTAAPDEVWEDLPRDLAQNYKHYLYGHRKDAE